MSIKKTTNKTLTQPFAIGEVPPEPMAISVALPIMSSFRTDFERFELLVDNHTYRMVMSVMVIAPAFMLEPRVQLSRDSHNATVLAGLSHVDQEGRCRKGFADMWPF